jgi:hypothetical protein
MRGAAIGMGRSTCTPISHALGAVPAKNAI